MVKHSLHFKHAAVSAVAVALLGASGLVSAVGVDRLESTLYPNYVTPDMLLNADKDQQNWIHYGKDYSMTRYSGFFLSVFSKVRTTRP